MDATQPIAPQPAGAAVVLEDVTLLTAADSLGANLGDEQLDEYVRLLVAEVRRVCCGEGRRFRILCDVMLRPGRGPHILLSREGDMDGALGRHVWRALAALPAPSPLADVVMFHLAIGVNGGGAV